MNKIKRFIANTFFKELLPATSVSSDASSGGQRELASGFVKKLVYKTNDDNDFEEPDFDMEDIENAYNTDSYVRQGVDKYVDQIFKEGYSFYGKDTNTVDYLKLRLEYIAEATSTPTNQFLMDIAEDLVKYGNCMIVKSRSNDVNALPQGVNVQGIGGKEPVVGYFCANPSTMTVMRDEHGAVTKWKQETDAGEQEFNPEDVIHFYYKRPKGNAYGTSFLVPVLDDVRALRQAEENVLKMMYRNIYPFHHVQVGTEDQPGTEKEVDKVIEEINNMDVEGGIVTTERVKITPIASDKVIDAEPYLRYMEDRVFSGMGIPAIMWGRGDTANRSTGDNMTSEMADRIRAITKIIEMFFNAFIVKELLMEGGYDPVLNPDQIAELKFHDNDVDVKIKKEVHAIYKYEHNAITEDEMRDLLGMDPIADGDREKLFVELITRETLRLQAELDEQTAKATANLGGSTGNKETNNKEKNSGGQKSKKSSSSGKDNYNVIIGLVKDSVNKMNDEMDKYVINCYTNRQQILQSNVESIVAKHIKDISYTMKAKIEDKTLIDVIDKMLIKNSVKLCSNIHDDLTGVNVYSTSRGSVSDMITVRVNLFGDTITNYLRYKTNATKFIDGVERSSENGYDTD